MGIKEAIERLGGLQPSDRVGTIDIGQHAVLMIGGHEPFAITPAVQRLERSVRAFCDAHWQHIREANAVSKTRGFSHPGIRSYCMGGRLVLTIYDGENYLNINGSSTDAEDRPGLTAIDWTIEAATDAVEKLTEEFDPSCYQPDSSVSYHL